MRGSVAPLLTRRFDAGTVIESVPYGAPVRMGATSISFHPAGHILGSAQIRIEGPGGVVVVGGDYKRAADPTCPPFEPIACDTFVTESTFALPIFRWDPAAVVVADILAWWDANRAAGLASVLFCYTLGKAQRLLAELAGVTDRRVLVHGAMASMIAAYREAGVRMLETALLIERARGKSCAGELILAPLSARGTPWMRRAGDFSDAFVSGTMRVRGVRRQRNVDRGLCCPIMPTGRISFERSPRSAPLASSPPMAIRSAGPLSARAGDRQRRHPDGVEGEGET